MKITSGGSTGDKWFIAQTKDLIKPQQHGLGLFGRGETALQTCSWQIHKLANGRQAKTVQHGNGFRAKTQGIDGQERQIMLQLFKRNVWRKNACFQFLVKGKTAQGKSGSKTAGKGKLARIAQL